MKSMTRTLVMCGMVLAVAILMAADTQAGNFTRKTIFTTRLPIQIPGTTLPAGTYTLILMEHNADRNIVQVMDEDQLHLYATLIAIPKDRLHRTEETIFTYYEMPKGEAPALRDWFYPGEYHGLEFVYTGTVAEQIAEARNRPPVTQEELGTRVAAAEPAPAMPPPMEPVRAPAPAPVTTEEPSRTQSPAAVISEDKPTRSDTAPTPAPVNVPKELPETASPLPLLGLIGLAFLGVGLSIRLFRR